MDGVGVRERERERGEREARERQEATSPSPPTHPYTGPYSGGGVKSVLLGIIAPLEERSAVFRLELFFHEATLIRISVVSAVRDWAQGVGFVQSRMSDTLNSGRGLEAREVHCLQQVCDALVCIVTKEGVGF